MNKLPLHKRVQILNLLVEGNSLRATSRITDCSINTVTKFLVDIGQAAGDYQDAVFRNLPCKRIQVDEIWSFCYAKKKNLGYVKKPVLGMGDVWTWTSICADTKLVPCWRVGERTKHMAYEFIKDLSTRFKNRIQLTSDGYKSYLDVVEAVFGDDVDFGMMVKVFEDETKYRADTIDVSTKAIIGNPDPNHISTSFVERQNLTMRTNIKRFTRRTNAFSKKIQNHTHAVSLHFMYYNFGRIHKTLRVTPAMEAGISDHIWNLEEIIQLFDKNSN
jgi:IS1 family transposase